METKEKKKSWITVKETIDGLQRSYETLKVLYFSYGVRFKTTTKDRGAEIFVPYEHISSIVTIPLHPKKEEVG